VNRKKKVDKTSIPIQIFASSAPSFKIELLLLLLLLLLICYNCD